MKNISKMKIKKIIEETSEAADGGIKIEETFYDENSKQLISKTTITKEEIISLSVKPKNEAYYKKFIKFMLGETPEDLNDDILTNEILNSFNAQSIEEVISENAPEEIYSEIKGLRMTFNQEAKKLIIKKMISLNFFDPNIITE